MLYDPHEVEEGATVYLFPHTKGASRACMEQRTVQVAQPPAKFWPYVIVTWRQGTIDKWERVHKDNIKKKPTAPKATKQEGDGAGGGRSTDTGGRWQRKLALPGRIKPIDIPEGQEQGELF